MCRHEGYLSTMVYVWAREENLQELGMGLRSSSLVVSFFTFWIFLDPGMDKINNKNYDIYALASSESVWWNLKCVWYVKDASLEGYLLFGSYMTFRRGSASKTEQCLVAEGLRKEWEGLRRQVKSGEAQGDVLSSTDAVPPCHIIFVPMHIKVHKNL